MALAFQVKQAPSQEKGFPVANSKIEGSLLGQGKTLLENEGPLPVRLQVLVQVYFCFSQSWEGLRLCRHLLQPVMCSTNLRADERSYRAVSISVNSSTLFLQYLSNHRGGVKKERPKLPGLAWI